MSSISEKKRIVFSIIAIGIFVALLIFGVIFEFNDLGKNIASVRS